MAVRHGAVVCGGEKMLTNADCTLYKFQDGCYERYVVENVYWYENQRAGVSKSGLNNTDNLTVFFYSSDVIPQTPTKDILVKGSVDFEFDNTSPQKVSESMQEFQKGYSFFVVTAVYDYMYGGLPHIEISAR